MFSVTQLLNYQANQKEFKSYTDFVGELVFGQVLFNAHKIMNTEFISSWKRTRRVRHYMAEFNNGLIITASLRCCRKSIFTLFYMRSQILNHAIIFLNIRFFVFFFSHFRTIPSKVLSFYYSNRPCFVGIPGLESSKLPTGASSNQFGETCQSLVSPQICRIRLGNL